MLEGKLAEHVGSSASADERLVGGCHGEMLRRGLNLFQKFWFYLKKQLRIVVRFSKNEIFVHLKHKIYCWMSWFVDGEGCTGEFARPFPCSRMRRDLRLACGEVGKALCLTAFLFKDGISQNKGRHGDWEDAVRGPSNCGPTMLKTSQKVRMMMMMMMMLLPVQSTRAVVPRQYLNLVQVVPTLAQFWNRWCFA